MEQQILRGSPPNEILDALRANAWKVQPDYNYTRELEESEVQERQNDLSQAMINIDGADQILTVAKEKHKAIVNPLKHEIKTVLSEIRTRSEEISGEVFLIKDEHEERMGFYSKEGKLIFERRLLPEEMQYSIVDNFKIAKNG